MLRFQSADKHLCCLWLVCKSLEFSYRYITLVTLEFFWLILWRNCWFDFKIQNMWFIYLTKIGVPLEDAFEEWKIFNYRCLFLVVFSNLKDSMILWFCALKILPFKWANLLVWWYVGKSDWSIIIKLTEFSWECVPKNPCDYSIPR